MKLDLAPFGKLIRERCGLAFEGNNEDKLIDALKKRLHALNQTPACYLALLADNGDEFEELVNLLTINETYFFREPQQIRLLVDRLAPRMLAARGDQGPVRILSAGCSSGEEPYSLVMALTDKYGESVSRLFSFVGCDIDSSVLGKAREARYAEFSFRGVPPEVRARHFDKNRHGNVVKEPVRRLVRFHQLNLLSGMPPPDVRDFDIVFFRNVSIYFDTPTRTAIQQNIAAVMRDDGALVVGAAETLANDLGVLSLVEEDGLFYFVKGKAPKPALVPAIKPVVKPFPQPSALARSASSEPRKPPVAATPAPKPAQYAAQPSDGFARARQLVRDKRFDEAMPLIDDVLAQDHGNREAAILKAHILIDRREFLLAQSLAETVLAADNWSIDALLLLGLSAKWQQLDDEAIRWFKQAVYAHHECWPAHYYLADLYRSSGQVEPARRTLRVVMQLLSGDEPDHGIQYLPLALPVGEIRFLCERQLAKLSGANALAAQK